MKYEATIQDLIANIGKLAKIWQNKAKELKKLANNDKTSLTDAWQHRAEAKVFTDCRRHLLMAFTAVAFKANHKTKKQAPTRLKACEQKTLKLEKPKATKKPKPGSLAFDFECPSCSPDDGTGTHEVGCPNRYNK